MNSIFEKLVDEESLWVYNLCKAYNETSDKWMFAHAVIARHPEIRFPEIETIVAERNCRNIYVIDSNLAMSNYAAILNKCGYHARFASSWEELAVDINDWLFFVFQKEMYDLIPERYEERTVFSNRRFHGRLGNQYFDVFLPEKNEVYIDIGGFQGETTLSFLQWCNNEYSSIYIFEPNEHSFKICQSKIKEHQLQNCYIYNWAVWDSCGNKPFDTSDHFRQMAHIDEHGECLVKTVALDSMDFSGKSVSFIKIDAEGAEKEIIQGASKIIKKDKPKLAVSVYHKPNDYIELAELLLEIEPEYKLCFRQYHSDPKETILYAFV